VDTKRFNEQVRRSAAKFPVDFMFPLTAEEFDALFTLLNVPRCLTIIHNVRRPGMSEATITSKGQVTIPAEIRKAMGLKPGERVVFTQLDDGTTVFRAKTRSIVELRGILKHARRTKRRVSIKDMNIGRS